MGRSLRGYGRQAAKAAKAVQPCPGAFNGSSARPGWACALKSPPIAARAAHRSTCASPRWNGLGVAMADSQTQWPLRAAVLMALGNLGNTLQAQGELSLSTKGLSVEWLAGRMAMEGSTELTARHMSSPGYPPCNLWAPIA